MLLRQGMFPLTAGLAAGLAGALALGRSLQHLILSVPPLDAVTCAAAAMPLAAAGSAVWSATRRVVRMDPTAALRVE
jgi:putative ABC transport system permease protein